MKNKRYIMPAVLGFAVLALVGALALKNVPVEAEAASSSELKEQLEALEKEQQEIQGELDRLEGLLTGNATEIEALVNKKNIIDQEVFNLYQKSENINAQITVYGALIADKQEELEEAQTHLAELNEKNKARIRAMEEGGKLSYWSVLFEANSFSDFLDRLNMVEEIAASDEQRLKEMSAAAEEVEAAKVQLQEGQAALEVSKEALDTAQEEMQAKSKEAEKLLSDLVAKGEEYEKYIADMEAAEEDLRTEIGDVEDLYEDAKYSEWLETSVPPTTTRPTYNGGQAGDATVTGGITWLNPTSYTRVSSPYGWRVHPVYGDWRFHNGVDLSAEQGTPIIATRSGVVTVATYHYQSGYYVYVNHQDGFISKYLHMTHYVVGPGDYVKAGEIIGYVGSTGTSTGPHLHFTIEYQGNYVNPADYIDF